MARHRRHYEVWDSTPTGADIVGRADSLPAALMLYLHTRKATPHHTINLLGDKPTSRRPAGRSMWWQLSAYRKSRLAAPEG
jgi:hypothetical protein